MVLGLYPDPENSTCKYLHLVPSRKCVLSWSLLSGYRGDVLCYINEFLFDWLNGRLIWIWLAYYYVVYELAAYYAFQLAH